MKANARPADTSAARLVYPKPARTARATIWSARWRRRWHEAVGPVFVDRSSGELIAHYPANRDRHRRLQLQAEMEGRANGTAQVVAACKLADDLPAGGVTEEYALDWAKRWHQAGGRLRVGPRGVELIQGFNPDAMVAEWAVVGRTVIALAARARAAAYPRRHDGGRKR